MWYTHRFCRNAYSRISVGITAVMRLCMHDRRAFVACSQYKDQLMAVGRARQTGIEVPGLGIVSAGKFEEHAGSKLHRPNQHTLAPSGKSLQVKRVAKLLLLSCASPPCALTVAKDIPSADASGRPSLACL